MELTLFEVHLDDASFTANAPYSGASSAESDESPDAASAETGEETERPGVLPFLIGLAALAGLGYLVRRRLGNGGDVGTEIEPEIAEPEAPTP